MKPIAEEFGVNVKNRRIELRMSQEKLAELADLDRTTIILIESGKANVQLITLAAIADALQVQPMELLKTD